MKIDGYNNVQNEGIRCISEVTPDELGERIKTGEIDDGYTLAAYSLYTAYMRSLA